MAKRSQGRELVSVNGKFWEDCLAAAFCAAEVKYKVERKQMFVACVKFFLPLFISWFLILSLWSVSANEEEREFDN